MARDAQRDRGGAAPWLVTCSSTPTPDGTETTGGEMSPLAAMVTLVSTWAPWARRVRSVPWCFCFLALGTSGGAEVLVVVVVGWRWRRRWWWRPRSSSVVGADAAGVAVACSLELGDEPPQPARPSARDERRE